MLRALELYGPDHGAQRTLGEVALGRQLKRMLPEDRYDRAPIEGGGRLLVADIRLDNREDLIGDLRLDAGWARTACDTAILFAALDRWGEDALQRVAGDFALAWWDQPGGRLILARSPLSHRPLHFHMAEDFFAFASMPKGLHALPEVPCAPDLDRFARRVATAQPLGPGSFFEGVERVQPGRMVTVTPGRRQSSVFWSPARRILRLARPADYEEGLREALDRAVGASLRGVGDVASQLSGGLDSTSVAASAALLQARRGAKVFAYTAAPRMGFDGPARRGRFGDESGHAAAVAALYPNLEHHVVRPGRRGPLDDWDRSAYLFDKPVLNPINAIWSYDILDAVRAQGLNVLLCGDVGNATISYDGREIFTELLRDGRWLHWWREALALVRHGGGSWRHVMKHTLKPMLPTRILRLIPGTDAHALDAFGRRTAVPAAQAERFARMRSESLPKIKDGWSARVELLMRVDHGNEHKGILAGWGVENRDPTADRRLAEFCLSVPTDQYFRDGLNRSLVRRAMSERLPRVVTDEQRGGLQSADWYERLSAERGRLLEELDRLEACAPLAERTDVAKLRAAVENWPTEGWDGIETMQLYSVSLMRTLCAAHFARRVLGTNA